MGGIGVPGAEDQIVQGQVGRLQGGQLVMSGMGVMAWEGVNTLRAANSVTAPQPVLPPDASEARA